MTPEGISGDRILVKLVWHPADILDGRVLPTAFRSEDILAEVDSETNRPSFISVDRSDMISKIATDARIDSQTSEGKAEKQKRLEANFAFFICQTIRDIVDNRGTKPFEVRPEPIFPENPAHCGIHNVSGQKGRSCRDELRAYLCNLVQKILPYSEMFVATPTGPNP